MCKESDVSQKPFSFTPCYERWETMSPSDRGRLCAKCNTQIVDFRNSTEADIERTIAESPVKICGYYSIAQFQKPGSRLAAAAAAATIALAFPTVAQGSQQSQAAMTVPDKVPADSTLIRGIVRDSVSGLPLHGAQVMIENTRIGTLTDSVGHFRIVARPKFDHPVKLMAQIIGYHARTLELIARGDTAEIEFALPQTNGIIGVVEIIRTHSPEPAPKPSFWRRIWRFFGGS